MSGRKNIQRKRAIVPHWRLPPPAFKDEEQVPPAGNKSIFQIVAQYVLPLLGLCGLTVYALLTLTYNRFYEALGIQPADVGLSYAGTLASSTGFVVYFLYSALAAFLCAFTLIALLNIASHRHWKPADMSSDVTRLWQSWIDHRNLLGPIFLTFVLITFVAIPFVGPSPERVRQGLPIAPRRESILPFISQQLPVSRYPIFAYPASIKAIQGVNDSPVINDLRARPLLYLGQSNGIAVLYDSTEDNSLFLPLSSMALRISSCTETHKCTIPQRMEVGCISWAKSQRTTRADLLGLENNTVITETAAITAIRDGDLSLYFEDPAGEVVDLVIGGSVNSSYIKSIRDADGLRDLRSIPTCR